MPRGCGSSSAARRRLRNARAIGFFDETFDGSQSVEEVVAYLKDRSATQATEADYPLDGDVPLAERITQTPCF